jgi:hypothetical protein
MARTAILIPLLLGACAGTPSPHLEPPGQLAAGMPGTSIEICEYKSAHRRGDGTEVFGGFFCPVYKGITSTNSRTAIKSSTTLDGNNSSIPRASGNHETPAGNIPTGCSYVSPYSTSDGKYVGPFVRCSTSSSVSAYKVITAGAEPAPCVTSYCGPVSVKGYFRKDGTYVRPHTRKK